MRKALLNAVIHEYFKVLGEAESEIFIKCPFCGKERNHCSVNIEKEKFHCFKCGRGGTIEFLLKYHNPTESLEELLQDFAGQTPLVLLENIHKTAQEKVNNPDWTEDTISITDSGYICRLAQEYLCKRQVNLELAKELLFRVGIAGKKLGYIVIPIIDGGVVRNYVGRKFFGGGERYTGPTKAEAFTPKSQLLYGFDRISTSVILVEGIFDALALWDLPVVALMGKEASPEQTFRILDRVQRVVVLLDAGCQRETQRIAQRFVGFVDTQVAFMPDGSKDASDNPALAREALSKAKDYYEVF